NTNDIFHIPINSLSFFFPHYELHERATLVLISSPWQKQGMLNKVKFIFIIVTSVHFLPHAPARRCTCWRCASETAVATMESEETKTDDMVVLGTPYLEDCEPSSPRNNMYSFQTSLKEGKGFPLSSACLRCAACIAVAEKV
ncbi:hypothetical protein C0J52_27869, partial [Blattella germanica]